MTDFDPFAGGAIAQTVDSTEAQREIWLVAKFGGDTANLAYNESITLELAGEIDVDVLRSSADSLVTRHDALRSSFSTDGQSLIINEDPALDFKLQDLRDLSDEQRKLQRAAAREDEVRQVFNLETGPLIRFQLLQLSDTQVDLIISAHHIVCDGWSIGVMVEELDALCKTGGIPGPDLAEAPSFVDHAIADRKALYSAETDAAEIYWTDLLGERPQELDLPSDHPRFQSMVEVDGIPTRDLCAIRIDHQLNSGLTKSAIEAAKKSSAGLSAMMLANFAILLRRLSGQEDFVIGVPAAAQAFTGQYGLVGHCVQMLPIRIQCNGQTTVKELAKSIKLSLLDGFENQGLTFGALLQRLRLQRDASRIPLIPVTFNLDQSTQLRHLGDHKMTVVSNPRFAENFELFLNITPVQDTLILEATFRTGLFDADTMNEWLESYETTLASCVSQLESPIDEIDTLSQRQRRRQLLEWNNTHRPLEPADATVLSRISSIAEHAPDRIAVQDQHESISYKELLNRANGVAKALISAGTPAGANIGICRPPGIDMLVGLLGIWKAQCAYIPLDPDYPKERLSFIIKDTGTTLILGEGASTPDFAANCEWLTTNGKTEHDKAALVREPLPNDVAYVIHTSGSTGQPKGVIIEHAALNNLICAMAREPGMDKNGTLLAVTSLSFDISTLELFLPLTIGAKLVLASRDQIKDTFALSRLLLESKANYMQATPSAWRALLDSGWEGNEQLTVLCGGEELPLLLAQTLASKVKSLWNMYGPTEATVWTTVEQIPKDPSSITIGRPIDNTTALVLDEQFRLLPPGATGGELFLGGDGLARGYLDQAKLTAERFPDNPFDDIPGDRLYRTGDLVKLAANGNIHFLGRKDNQVKIRGFRVELGEIESVLVTADNVNTVVAIVRDIAEGDSRLVAYVLPEEDAEVDVPALQGLAIAKLPPQCVPQHIVLIDEIPQTANGKIDRKALPDPIAAVSTAPVELSTESQKKLGEIWCELLRLDQVGAHDDFFLLGGHSMVAVRMLSQVRELFSLELPLQSIFQDRNVANLAARIDLLLMQKDNADNPDQQDLEIVEF